MKKRTSILLVTLLALAVFAGLGLGLWRLQQWRIQRREARIAALEAEIPAANTSRAAGAARQLLAMDPDRHDVRLRLARVLLDMGQQATARETLRHFRDRKSPHFIPAYMLLVRAYLDEATDLALRGPDGATPEAYDEVRGAVESALESADNVLVQIADRPGHEVQVLLSEARARRVKLMLLHHRLRGIDAKIQRVRAVDFEEEVRALADRQRKLRDRIQTLQDELIERCRRVIEHEPAHAMARALMFEMWLEAGAFDRARAAAGDFVSAPASDPNVVAHVAETLLDLENQYGQPPRDEDAALARRLLDRSQIAESRDIACLVARLSLLVRDGAADEAIRLAEDILALHPGHVRTVCLLAAAHLQRDESEKVVEMLDRFQRRVDTPRVASLLGIAMIRSGSVPGGQSKLRHAIELREGFLPAYLDLAESMASAGHVIEAEPEILAAVGLSPKHPRVVALHARLLLERRDRSRLSAFLMPASPPGDAALDETGLLGPRDVLLASAMALDHLDLVGRLCDWRLAAIPSDRLALVARAWRLTEPVNRRAVASTVVASMIQQLSADPMQRRRALAPVEQDGGAGDFESLDGVIPARQMLREARFHAGAYSRAESMLAEALRHWPSADALVDQRRRLGLWLDWYEATPSAPSGMEPEASAPTAALIRMLEALRRGSPEKLHEVLRALLERHPWAEPVVLIAIAHLMQRPEAAEHVDALLGVVDDVNPRLALLAGARVDLVRGDPREGLIKIELLFRSEPSGSEVRRMAADIHARLCLAATRYEEAVGVFDNLSITAPDQQLDMKLALTRVMAENDRETAGVVLATMLRRTNLQGSTRMTPYWLDRVLAQGETFIDDDQLVDLLKEAQPSRDLWPVMRLYHVRALLRLKRLPAARVVLAQLEARKGDAPAVAGLREALDAAPEGAGP
ncbi:MAG: hypothetical protein CMJ18_12590 [Phycisphaeraceae bacterium]|nr:hypothetical protein [Phycisphaeraceae bacterium]